MLNVLRPAINRVARPVAGRLLRAGVTPDMVTVAGTVGVSVGSLAFLSRGMFLTGSLVAVLSVFTDMLDGAMARQRGTTSRFGAWLDSTCDRVADAAVFCSLAWWYTGGGASRLLAAVTLYCLVSGVVVSYAKARAEGLGLRCDVGFAERAERLTLTFVGTSLLGLGAPDGVLAVVLWLLAGITTVTVAQRAVEVTARPRSSRDSPRRVVAAALRARAVDAGYAAGWALVRALPEPVALRLFRAGADLAARRGGRGVEQLRRNLERVAPGEDLVQAALRSYARYWCEVFRLPVTSRERVLSGMTTTGEDAFRAAVAAPTGTVLALPHSGNWDHAGAWCGAVGAPFTTVAERLEPEALFDRFLAFRQSLGMEVIPLTGGERPPYAVLAERLEAGGMLCLLADRDLSARGVDVTFFGERTRMPAGPASLALQTGATLLPVTLSFTPGGWHCTWHDAVPHTDVPTMTQALADAFARGIAAHPADWHMLQRLWLDDLPADDPRRAPA